MATIVNNFLMNKKPVNLTLTVGVLGFADEVMALRGHNSLSGFVEELIRKEYELRFGPIKNAAVESQTAPVK